jgi:hypothetical protein
MFVVQGCKYAVLSICAAAVLSIATLSPTEAVGRARVQDHRNPNIGGQAVPGGYHIRCVIFCGNSFNPHGRRPTGQDHRSGTTVAVPESPRHGGHPPNPYERSHPPIVPPR